MGEKFENKIIELSETYEFPVRNIKQYVEKLLSYPCVTNNPEEYMMDVLEIIIQDRVSMDTLNEQYRRSSSESIETALLYVYNEDAIPYINKKLVERYSNKIR